MARLRLRCRLTVGCADRRNDSKGASATREDWLRATWIWRPSFLSLCRPFSLQPWPCASGASTCIRSGQCPKSTISVHVSRSVKARLATKLLLGFEEPSIFSVANRLTAEAASSIIFNRLVSSSALRPQERRHARRTTRARSTVCAPGRQCQSFRLSFPPPQTVHHRDSRLCG